MVKEKGIVVCSLFDGMSGTQMALKNMGIKVDKYYASEIDKYAIEITRKNFPDTIHLGDVKDIKGEDFIRDIDLVVAGSPCQGFSFAGKQLAFDDERSALFFEFIRILREVKPKYFLLENVRMKKEFQDVISEQISSVYPEYTSGGLFGIEPILINSALVSAQNRQRLYWTNIPNIEQPEDLGIVLRDVLDEFPSREFYAGQELQKNYKGGNQLNPDYKSQANTLHDIDKKSPTISAGTHGYANGYISEKANDELKKMTTKDGKSYALTASYQGAVAWNSIEKKQRTMIPTYDKEPKVSVEESDNGITNIKKGTSGRSWFFEQQTYSPNSDKTRALKAGSGSGNIPKVLNKEPEGVVNKKVNLKEYNDEIAINPRNFGGKGYVGTDKKSVALTQPSGNNATLVRVNKEPEVETYDTPKQVGTAADIKGYDSIKRVYSEDGKSPTLTTMGGGHREPKVAVKSMTEVRTPEANKIRLEHKKKTGKDWSPRHMRHLVERKDDKSNTITANTSKQHTIQIEQEEELTWRKLTPLECERLQTFPDNYTEGVSNTQRYKMLGNGFTVRVIEHILKNMEI